MKALPLARKEATPCLGKKQSRRLAWRERGIALGKSQALAQAQAVAQMRKKVMDIVIARFLSLVGLANGVVAAISNSDLLLDLLVKLAQAQSTEDAEQALLNAQAVQES